MMRGGQDSEDMGAAGQAVSPIDRLETMGQHMSALGAAFEKVAGAAKPLYASLDDAQKRRFALIGRALFMMGHGHRGMDMMGMMGAGAMGRGDMDRDCGRMERMGNGRGEGDSPDEE